MMHAILVYEYHFDIAFLNMIIGQYSPYKIYNQLLFDNDQLSWHKWAHCHLYYNQVSNDTHNYSCPLSTNASNMKCD